MRILFWQEAFTQRGGIRVFAESLLPALRERGHVIEIVTAQESPEQAPREEWNGFPLRRFPFWHVLERKEPRMVLALQRQIEQLVRTLMPDVIHLSGFGPTALFARHAQRTGAAPLLVSLHSSNTIAASEATLFAYTVQRADWMSACSQSLLDAARQSVPAITSRSSVIHNGVATPAVAPKPLPFAPPCVLCLGYLGHDKGFDVLLHAAPALLARFPTLRIVVVGDGPARAVLEQQARNAGIGDAVELRGAVPHDAVPDLINDATVVVVPSRRESFGLVAVEAAVLQRPVVATNVGGLPEVVIDAETGLLIPPDDSAALGSAVARLLSDRMLAERLGAAARDRAQRLFGLTAQRNAFEAIYARLCASRAEPQHIATTAGEEAPSCE